MQVAAKPGMLSPACMVGYGDQEAAELPPVFRRSRK